MRRPGARFTMRQMMGLVAISGLACLGGREYWERWGRQRHPNHVYSSRLSATAGQGLKLQLVAGRPIPVVITYDFKFAKTNPAPGMTCLLFAEVWFRDEKTGLVVDGYTFDAPLTVGRREAAQGSFIWDAILPRPGRYHLDYLLYYEEPTGELRRMNGGGHGYSVVAATPPSDPPNGARAKR